MSGKTRRLMRRILEPMRETVRLAVTPAAEERELCFLVSAPRSGSTWTRRALNQHPEVHCTEQRLFGGFRELWTDDVAEGRQGLRITLDAYVEALAGPLNAGELAVDRRALEDQLIVSLAQTLIGYARSRSGKRWVVDKVTPYLGTSRRVAESIRRYFPHAKLIYLLRDGRDVATSGVFDWLRKSPGERGHTEFQRRRLARFVEGGEDEPLTRFFEPEEIRAWAAYWTEPLEQMQAEADLTVSYEAMKRDQPSELRRILECLGVAADDAVVRRCVEESSFRKMSRGREAGDARATDKVRKGIVGDWRSHFTRADGELFHRLAGAPLLRLGFESDPDWFRSLPEALHL
jgi:hypothetical protein